MDYNKITKEDIEVLIDILDDDRVTLREDINEDYSHDELAELKAFPEIMIEPETTEEVSQVMKFASKRNIPVTPRGTGTGLCGGAVAMEAGILLLTTSMDRIIEIDEENLTAKVQPGVILMNFSEKVNDLGFMYPPDPGEKSATLGGNVLTNAGGMRAVKYGVTRDYVLGMEIVLPNGEIIDTGGKVVKNSSGYSIQDLIIGSEGTLGIVTEITLKLVPMPKKALTLLIPFDSLEEAIGTVPEIINAKIVPTGIEFMEKEVLLAATDYLGKEFPDTSAPAYLLLKFDGNDKKEIEKKYEVAADVCLENNAYDVYIANTDERQDVIWDTRGALLEALKAVSELDECDVVVPRNKVADFVNFTHNLEDKHKLRIRGFGHAGDGNLHLYTLKDDLDDETWQKRNKAVMDELYAKSREMKGKVSGEHGIAIAKKEYLHADIGPVQLGLMRGIKNTFDPQNILNPGKTV
ncbi:Glycolate dehydrogenase, subunit GlcD [Halanaerobium saccharolyticum subsp. saccharolyticum DSM 6643]|uniref:Glycolate dehydrogenase, subunit GlcD n=1 Tax=Halanaerobium saccharolyticum subsp. saccharolyticum DSM 6643 TaxID=1293054 RepID=M5DZY6_9FIRM|nr:FAD-linked oxidase C-terminal domain-containing protein [Halanaerobium saccharolyticum]CCU78906.1 Glycolate dehydrogenase, subunit GlcD [Halanaerobium saccharolyticum subsp. saccharolyticum DSM 6643]